MGNIKLSIVIPMYKVEPYIEKCLVSCVNQSPLVLGEDYEIICINDGSPDNSGNIAQIIASNHFGIYVYNQENKGLSAARNRGTDLAKGEYIWYVDSDDWIASNCLEIIFPSLTGKLDILEIQYKNAYENGKESVGESCSIKEGILNGRQATINGGIHTPAQFSIFRTQFLKENKLEFVRGIYHEDVEFRIRALLLAEQVSSIPDVCYYYYQRAGGSITSNFKLKNGQDLLFVLNRHYKFVQNYDKDVKRAIYLKISMWLNAVFLGIRQLKGDDYEKLYKELRECKHLFCAMRHSGNLKYMIEGCLLGISVRLGLKLHSLLR